MLMTELYLIIVSLMILGVIANLKEMTFFSLDSQPKTVLEIEAQAFFSNNGE